MDYKVCGRCVHYLENGICKLDNTHHECDDEACKKQKLFYIDEMLIKYGRNNRR